MKINNLCNLLKENSAGNTTDYLDITFRNYFKILISLVVILFRLT